MPLQVTIPKRIVPEAVSSDQRQPVSLQAPSATAKARVPAQVSRPPKAPNSLPNGSLAGPAAAGAKRKALHQPGPASTRRRVTPAHAPQPPESEQPAVGVAQPAIAFQQEPHLHVELGREALPLGDQPEPGSRVLEAVHQDGRWQLMCFSSGVQQWSDLLPSKIFAVGGSMHFAAAASESAVLQVRRAPALYVASCDCTSSLGTHA